MQPMNQTFASASSPILENALNKYNIAPGEGLPSQTTDKDRKLSMKMASIEGSSGLSTNLQPYLTKKKYIKLLLEKQQQRDPKTSPQESMSLKAKKKTKKLSISNNTNSNISPGGTYSSGRRSISPLSAATQLNQLSMSQLEQVSKSSTSSILPFQQNHHQQPQNNFYPSDSVGQQQFTPTTTQNVSNLSIHHNPNSSFIHSSATPGQNKPPLPHLFKPPLYSNTQNQVMSQGAASAGGTSNSSQVSSIVPSQRLIQQQRSNFDQQSNQAKLTQNQNEEESKTQIILKNQNQEQPLNPTPLLQKLSNSDLAALSHLQQNNLFHNSDQIYSQIMIPGNSLDYHYSSENKLESRISQQDCESNELQTHKQLIDFGTNLNNQSETNKQLQKQFITKSQKDQQIKKLPSQRLSQAASNQQSLSQSVLITTTKIPKNVKQVSSNKILIQKILDKKRSPIPQSCNKIQELNNSQHENRFIQTQDYQQSNFDISSFKSLNPDTKFHQSFMSSKQVSPNQKNKPKQVIKRINLKQKEQNSEQQALQNNNSNIQKVQDNADSQTLNREILEKKQATNKERNTLGVQQKNQNQSMMALPSFKSHSLINNSESMYIMNTLDQDRQREYSQNTLTNANIVNMREGGVNQRQLKIIEDIRGSVQGRKIIGNRSQSSAMVHRNGQGSQLEGNLYKQISGNSQIQYLTQDILEIENGHRYPQENTFINSAIYRQQFKSVTPNPPSVTNLNFANVENDKNDPTQSKESLNHQLIQKIGYELDSNDMKLQEQQLTNHWIENNQALQNRERVLQNPISGNRDNLKINKKPRKSEDRRKSLFRKPAKQTQTPQQQSSNKKESNKISSGSTFMFDESDDLRLNYLQESEERQIYQEDEINTNGQEKRRELNSQTEKKLSSYQSQTISSKNHISAKNLKALKAKLPEIIQKQNRNSDQLLEQKPRLSILNKSRQQRINEILQKSNIHSNQEPLNLILNQGKDYETQSMNPNLMSQFSQFQDQQDHNHSFSSHQHPHLQNRHTFQNLPHGSFILSQSQLNSSDQNDQFQKSYHQSYQDTLKQYANHNASMQTSNIKNDLSAHFQGHQRSNSHQQQQQETLMRQNLEEQIFDLAEEVATMKSQSDQFQLNGQSNNNNLSVKKYQRSFQAINNAQKAIQLLQMNKIMHIGERLQRLQDDDHGSQLYVQTNTMNSGGIVTQNSTSLFNNSALNSIRGGREEQVMRVGTIDVGQLNDKQNDRATHMRQRSDGHIINKVSLFGKKGGNSQFSNSLKKIKIQQLDSNEEYGRIASHNFERISSYGGTYQNPGRYNDYQGYEPIYQQMNSFQMQQLDEMLIDQNQNPQSMKSQKSQDLSEVQEELEQLADQYESQAYRQYRNFSKQQRVAGDEYNRAFKVDIGHIQEGRVLDQDAQSELYRASLGGESLNERVEDDDDIMPLFVKLDTHINDNEIDENVGSVYESKSTIHALFEKRSTMGLSPIINEEDCSLSQSYNEQSRIHNGEIQPFPNTQGYQHFSYQRAMLEPGKNSQQSSSRQSKIPEKENKYSILKFQNHQEQVQQHLLQNRQTSYEEVIDDGQSFQNQLTFENASNYVQNEDDLQSPTQQEDYQQNQLLPMKKKFKKVKLGGPNRLDTFQSLRINDSFSHQGSFAHRKKQREEVEDDNRSYLDEESEFQRSHRSIHLENVDTQMSKRHSVINRVSDEDNLTEEEKDLVFDEDIVNNQSMFGNSASNLFSKQNSPDQQSRLINMRAQASNFQIRPQFLKSFTKKFSKKNVIEQPDGWDQNMSAKTLSINTQFGGGLPQLNQNSPSIIERIKQKNRRFSEAAAFGMSENNRMNSPSPIQIQSFTPSPVPQFDSNLYLNNNQDSTAADYSQNGNQGMLTGQIMGNKNSNRGSSRGIMNKGSSRGLNGETETGQI